MTLAEIALALDQNIEELDKRPPAGGVEINSATGSAAEYARKWRSLTPQQRIERKRKQWEEECC